MLETTRTVIPLATDVGALANPDRHPFFQRPPDDPSDTQCPRVTLDRDVWIDMGRPEVVTVTIEPGDYLNNQD